MTTDHVYKFNSFMDFSDQNGEGNELNLDNMESLNDFIQQQMNSKDTL